MEALSRHIFFVVDQRHVGAMSAFGAILGEKDAEKSARAFAEMRGFIEEAAASSELRQRVARDPLFEHVKIPTTSSKSGSIGIRAGETPLEGDIPNLGRGADGFYGDGQTGWGARVRDIGGFVADLWPWGTLAKIDRGELTPSARRCTTRSEPSTSPSARTAKSASAVSSTPPKHVHSTINLSTLPLVV